MMLIVVSCSELFLIDQHPKDFDSSLIFLKFNI